MVRAGVAIWQRRRRFGGGINGNQMYDSPSSAPGSSGAFDTADDFDISPVTRQELNPFLDDTHATGVAGGVLAGEAAGGASAGAAAMRQQPSMVPVADLDAFLGASNLAFSGGAPAAAGAALRCRTGRSAESQSTSAQFASPAHSPAADDTGSHCEIDLVGGEPVRMTDVASQDSSDDSGAASPLATHRWTQGPLPQHVRAHSRRADAPSGAQKPSNIAATTLPSAFGSQGSSPQQPLSPAATASTVPPAVTRGTTADRDLLRHEPSSSGGMLHSRSSAHGDDGARTENMIQRRAPLSSVSLHAL